MVSTPNMKRLLFTVCVVVSSWLRADDAADGAKFFENEVRPILVKRCYECHGEKKQKGGLRVDGIAFLKAGGDTGPANPISLRLSRLCVIRTRTFKCLPRAGSPPKRWRFWRGG